MKQLISIRISNATKEKLDELAQAHGTQAEAVAVAIDRLHQERTMLNREERLQSFLASRPEFQYIVTEYTTPTPLYYPARTANAAAILAAAIVGELLQDGRLPHAVDVSTRTGFILAEISRAGKVEFSPDASRDGAYFSQVLRNAYECSLES